MNEIIELPAFQTTTPITTQQARARRDQLLTKAQGVTRVDSLLTAEEAGNALISLAEFTRAIESARKQVKEPVRELGKRIDDLARELTLLLASEAKRLGEIVGVWQAEQNRLANEAREKAERESAALWEAEQARLLAEQERVAAEEAKHQKKIDEEQRELAAKALRARTEAGRERAIQEAEQARVAAEIARSEREQELQRQNAQRNQELGRQIATVRMAGVNVIAAKPAGVATREDVDFEVTDGAALYKAFPHLLNLVPNRAAIKATLKGLAKGGTLPGVRHWKTANTHAR